jgi:hypothetical protein
VNHHCLLLCSRVPSPEKTYLKGLGHETDFKNLTTNLTDLYAR